MRILVTGGTGFLGSAVVPLLVEKGHEVRVIARSDPSTGSGRGATRLEKAGAKVVKGDLKDRDVLKTALAGVEVVYHLAGLVTWDRERGREMYDLHVGATKVLLEEAHAAGVKRIVLASTSGAIGVSKTDRVATEDDDYPIEVVGKWPYYLSKIFEEKLALEFCRKKQLPLVVLNPSLLLGPGDDRLSSTREVMLFMQKEIPSMPTGGISFVDVRDAAQAFVSALDKGILYERHLLGGANMSFKDYFGRLSRLTGVRPPPLKLPSTLNILGAYALDKWHRTQGSQSALYPQAVEMGEHFFYIDSTRAQRELGFSPRDPQETLLDTVRYIRDTFLGGQVAS